MKRRAFTLVELLVVVAILSIVAAMLLPALHSAVESARRTACAGDRKQNALAMLLFADDQRQIMPYEQRQIDQGGTWVWYEKVWEYRVSRQVERPIMLPGGNQYGCPMNLARNRPKRYLGALGTLVKDGYVPDPALMFCPAFERSGLSESYHFDDNPAARKERWDVLARGEHPGHKKNIYAGITHFLFTGYYQVGSHPDWPTPYPGHVLENLKLQEIAEGWRTTPYFSSAILSCTNIKRMGSGTFGFGSPQGLSHGGMSGLSFARYDGSVRWITYEDRYPDDTSFDSDAWVTTYPSGLLVNNGSYRFDKLQANMNQWNQ